MVSCVYHRSTMKDVEVLDGWWGFYPLGRHARATIPVDFTGPNILRITVVSVGGTFWLLVPCMKKLHRKLLHHLKGLRMILSSACTLTGRQPRPRGFCGCSYPSNVCQLGSGVDFVVIDAKVASCCACSHVVGDWFVPAAGSSLHVHH